MGIKKTPKVNASTAKSHSSRNDAGSSSTFRQRLNADSQQQTALPRKTPTQNTQKKSTSLYNQLKREFLEAAGVKSPPQHRTLATPKQDGLDVASVLAERLAAAGSKIHAKSINDIRNSFESVEKKISSLSEASSKAQSRADSLYDNISYPLSATLCHSKKRPRATIAEHLDSLQKELEAATHQLRALHVDWQECVRSEHEMWRELESQTEDVKPTLDFGAYESEVKAVTRCADKELSALDAEYKEYFQAETMKIMQQIMAD